jgi:hypothetical protein
VFKGEYAGLAALLHRALSNGRGGDKVRGREGDSLPLLVPLRCPELVEGSLCLLFAVLDELHQELSPGRGFELADISTSSIQVRSCVLSWGDLTNGVIVAS